MRSPASIFCLLALTPLLCAGGCDGPSDEGPVVASTTVANQPELPTAAPRPARDVGTAGAATPAPASTPPAPVHAGDLFKKGLKGVLGLPRWLADDVLVLGHKDGALLLELKAGSATRLPVKGELKAAAADVVVVQDRKAVQLYRVSANETAVYTMKTSRRIGFAAVLGDGARVGLLYSAATWRWVVVDARSGAVTHDEDHGWLKPVGASPDARFVLFTKERGEGAERFQLWDDTKQVMRPLRLKPEQRFVFGMAFHGAGEHMVLGHTGHIDTYALPAWTLEEGLMPTTITGDTRRDWRPLGFRDKDWVWVESDRAVSLAKLGGKIMTPVTVEPEPRIGHKTVAGDGSVAVITGALSGAIVAVRVGPDGKLVPSTIAEPSAFSSGLKHIQLSRTGRWLALKVNDRLQVVDVDKGQIVALPDIAQAKVLTAKAEVEAQVELKALTGLKAGRCMGAKACATLASRFRAAGLFAEAGETQAKLCRYSDVEGCRQAAKDLAKAGRIDDAVEVHMGLCRKTGDHADCTSAPKDLVAKLPFNEPRTTEQKRSRALCSSNVRRAWKQARATCVWRSVRYPGQPRGHGAPVGFRMTKVPRTLKKAFKLTKDEVVLGSSSLNTGYDCTPARVAAYLEQQCRHIKRLKKEGEQGARGGYRTVSLSIAAPDLSEARRVSWQ